METRTRKRGNSYNMTVRIDRKLKQQADLLFSELGMNTTTAINVFLRQSVREGRIPFTMGLERPNRETMEAMLETERMLQDPNTKYFDTPAELWEALEQTASGDTE